MVEEHKNINNGIEIVEDTLCRLSKLYNTKVPKIYITERSSDMDMFNAEAGCAVSAYQAIERNLEEHKCLTSIEPTKCPNPVTDYSAIVIDGSIVTVVDYLIDNKPEGNKTRERWIKWLKLIVTHEWYEWKGFGEKKYKRDMRIKEVKIGEKKAKKHISGEKHKNAKEFARKRVDITEEEIKKIKETYKWIPIPRTREKLREALEKVGLKKLVKLSREESLGC